MARLHPVGADREEPIAADFVGAELAAVGGDPGEAPVGRRFPGDQVAMQLALGIVGFAPEIALELEDRRIEQRVDAADMLDPPLMVDRVVADTEMLRPGCAR